MMLELYPNAPRPDLAHKRVHLIPCPEFAAEQLSKLDGLRIAACAVGESHGIRCAVLLVHTADAPGMPTDLTLDLLENVQDKFIECAER